MDWRSQEGRVRQGAEGKYALLKEMERQERKWCSNGSEKDQCLGKTGARLFQWVGVLLWACKSSEGARERRQEAKRSGRMSVVKAKSAGMRWRRKAGILLKRGHRESSCEWARQETRMRCLRLPTSAEAARGCQTHCRNSAGPSWNLAGLQIPASPHPHPACNE